MPRLLRNRSRPRRRSRKWIVSSPLQHESPELVSGSNRKSRVLRNLGKNLRFEYEDDDEGRERLSPSRHAPPSSQILAPNSFFRLPDGPVSFPAAS